jgi:Zn-dependent M28 family amino/carboxypeptidase
MPLFTDLNCSVSTGFGATDDGMGVITILQLIRFFTTPGNEPKRGIVAMLNNGEEDFLNGDSSANLISSKI